MVISEKHKIGTVSELLAASYFVSNNYVVSKPITDFNEYDLIVDNGSLKRVQVKTVYWDNSKSRYMISCVTSHIRGNENRYNKKYNENSFDLLCAIEPKTNSIYLIPIEKVAGRRGVTFYPEGKPITVNSRYEDFEQYKVQ
ncbi:group I intron-associated PD-(D/E)XK endonuclease [Bacillus cereus]|uniref:group I intron-associated PD-(D/E)XK endonuclease n=1 Tax=Bacillus cereus TaxID=1396 RepID=UPI000BF2DC11|nr:group I intron-associated PD-(D/E)XK endonuclease [Bacillus cereus]PFI75165.1 hypothetical protein COI83_30315 [Bacillus cereus]